jgi:serine phosphatase RsbU (regulator of sigma subunit)
VTEPSPRLTDVEDRRRAAMLGNVALALTVILAVSTVVSLFTSTFFPDPDVSLGYDGTLVIAGAAVAFWASLRLARRPKFEQGAWGTIIVIDVFLLGLGLLFEERSTVLALGYAAPVLCASIFLRARGTIAVFLLSGVFGSLHLAVTHVTLVDAAFVVGIAFAVTALTVVVAVIREGDLAQVKRLRELENAERERLRGELELARRVQLAMLPDVLPIVPGLDLAVFSEPAFEASGDFYDVFELDHLGDASGPALGIVVCDVAGKGVASALVMSATRAALRAEAERSNSLASVLAKVNETLAASIPAGLFVTLCYALFEPSSRTLRYCSAGHPHPLLWSQRDATVVELESFGMPLGLVAGSDYEEHSIHLGPGDAVMIFTDGLIEALDGERSMYGWDRTQADFTCHAAREATAAGQLEAVLTSMRAFVAGADLEDDVTVVTMMVPDVVDLGIHLAGATEEVACATDR